MQAFCKVFSFLYYCFNISKVAFLLGKPSVVGSRAALFVRKRTFHAPMVRCMWQSHVGWLFYVVARRAGGLQLIVNIFCRGGSRRTTAEH